MKSCRHRSGHSELSFQCGERDDEQRGGEGGALIDSTRHVNEVIRDKCTKRHLESGRQQERHHSIPQATTNPMAQEGKPNDTVWNGVKGLSGVNEDLGETVAAALGVVQGFFSEEDVVHGGSPWTEATLEGGECAQGTTVSHHSNGIYKGGRELKEGRETRNKCVLNDPIQAVTRSEESPGGVELGVATLVDGTDL